MSKAKGRYYDEFRDLRIDDSSVNSDYITELEKKAEMFDEMVINLKMAVDLFGDRDFLKAFLDRAKKIQGAQK